MNIRRKIASNTIYQIIGKIVTATSSLIVTALITRHFGANTFGEYSIVVTYVVTFYIMADFGVNAIVTKDFAKNKKNAKENFNKILGLRIAIGLLLSFIAFFVLYLLPYEKNVKQAIIVVLPMIALHSMYKAANIIFQAYLKYEYKAISDSVGSLVSLVIIYYLTRVFDPSLLQLALAYSSGPIITAIIGIYLVKEYLSKGVNLIDTKYWKFILLDAFPLGMALLMNVFMVHADRFLLSIMSTPYSVGIYSLAYKIFDVVLVLPTFFMNAMYPILASIKGKSKKKYSQYGSNAVWLMSVLSVFMTIPAIMLSKNIITGIWGSEMTPSYLPFNVLMFGVVTFFISSPLSWILVLENKQKVLPKLYGAAFIFNMVLNIIFIPIFDYMACAVITILTEVVVLVVLYIQLKKSDYKFSYFELKSPRRYVTP